MAVAARTKKIFDGRYEILAIVGRGSGSVVYQARHVNSPESEVALKVLIDQRNQTLNSDKLRKEALAMVSSRHRHVLRLDDFHSVGSLSYLCLEFAPESDLRKYVTTLGGTLGASQGELFLTQCLEGLGAVHRAGIIHRDIKPDNILVIDHREIRIADFGIALLPGEQVSFEDLQAGVGTMSYLAPEILEGRHYDHRSDLYALGVMFYELLSGGHPFENAPLIRQLEVRMDNQLAELSKIAKDVPARLSSVIMGMIRFDPEDRYQTAEEVLKALQNRSEEPQISERSAKTTNSAAVSAPFDSPDEADPFDFAAEEAEWKKLEEELLKDSEELGSWDDLADLNKEPSQGSEAPLPFDDPWLESDELPKNVQPAAPQAEKSSPPPPTPPTTPERSASDLLLTEGEARAQKLATSQSPTANVPLSALHTAYEIAVQARARTPLKLLGLLAAALIAITLLSSQPSKAPQRKRRAELAQLKVSATLPRFTGGEVKFPLLPTGVYSGTFSGFGPKPLPMSLIALEQGRLVVALGIHGWTPAVIDIALPFEEGNALRVSSNGVVFELLGERSGDKINGSWVNMITREKGTWSVAVPH